MASPSGDHQSQSRATGETEPGKHIEAKNKAASLQSIKKWQRA